MRSVWRHCLHGVIGLLTLAPAAASGQAMVEGMHYTFAPAEYSVPAPPALGPGKAKGLVIWSHGRSSEKAATDKASPLALYFAEQGWDVYALYRNWGNDDRLRALQIVQAGIEKARTLGYQRIVLMGQSAGAYASVEAVRYGAEVEAVVATAPAAFGSIDTAKNDWRENDFSMREIWKKYQGKHVKVVVAYFNEDPYYEASAPQVRGPWVEQTLTSFGIPHFVISQPTIGNLKGHHAGQTWNFTRRFGPCIYAFIETGRVPSCNDAAASLATFRVALPNGFPRRDGDPFAGLWQGTWSSGRFTLLAFGADNNGMREALYRSGLGASTDKPENIATKIQSQHDRLSWQMGRYVYELSLAADGTIAARRHDPTKPDSTATATLRRID